MLKFERYNEAGGKAGYLIRLEMHPEEGKPGSPHYSAAVTEIVGFIGQWDSWAAPSVRKRWTLVLFDAHKCRCTTYHDSLRDAKAAVAEAIWVGLAKEAPRVNTSAR